MNILPAIKASLNVTMPLFLVFFVFFYVILDLMLRMNIVLTSLRSFFVKMFSLQGLQAVVITLLLLFVAYKLTIPVKITVTQRSLMYGFYGLLLCMSLSIKKGPASTRNQYLLRVSLSVIFSSIAFIIATMLIIFYCQGARDYDANTFILTLAQFFYPMVLLAYCSLRKTTHERLQQFN